MTYRADSKVLAGGGGARTAGLTVEHGAPVPPDDSLGQLSLPADQRCQSCHIRPWRTLDSRWSRYQYAVCFECYDAATSGACICGWGGDHPRHLTLHQGWRWMNHVAAPKA